MTPEEQLLAAADDMAKYGHNKDTYYAAAVGWETSPACALGSIARVTGQTSANGLIPYVQYDLTQSEAVQKLAAQIRKSHPYTPDHLDDYQVITTYNDATTTTAEDMILTMKEAAHG